MQPLPDAAAIRRLIAGALEFGRPPERLLIKAPAEVRVVAPREGRLALFPVGFLSPHHSVYFRRKAHQHCLRCNAAEMRVDRCVKAAASR
jgi:hypothetical protein